VNHEVRDVILLLGRCGQGREMSGIFAGLSAGINVGRPG
jgi:hypothetical protein